MNAPLQALCAALSTGTAAAVAFACHLYHANWAIWSAYTVIRPSRSVSLKRSAQRILGAVIGCSIGFLAIETLKMGAALRSHCVVLHRCAPLDSAR